jgi:hypothetical protein
MALILFLVGFGRIAHGRREKATGAARVVDPFFFPFGELNSMEEGRSICTRLRYMIVVCTPDDDDDDDDEGGDGGGGGGGGGGVVCVCMCVCA